MNPSGEQNVVRRAVLYVDDFEPERLLLGHRLRESSVGLTTVAGVDEAIDAFNRRSFDAVISDLHLEGGRSGEELLRVIRSGGLHSGPFAFLTGESDVSTLSRLLSLGASAVLIKPIDAAALPAIVESLVTGLPMTTIGAFDTSHLLRSLPRCLDELRRASERRDSESAARVCRDLASTAGGYGMASICRQAEQAVGLISGGMQQPSTIDAIDRVIDSLRAALEAA